MKSKSKNNRKTPGFKFNGWHVLGGIGLIGIGYALVKNSNKQANPTIRRDERFVGHAVENVGMRTMFTP